MEATIMRNIMGIPCFPLVPVLELENEVNHKPHFFPSK